MKQREREEEQRKQREQRGRPIGCEECKRKFLRGSYIGMKGASCAMIVNHEEITKAAEKETWNWKRNGNKGRKESSKENREEIRKEENGL